MSQGFAWHLLRMTMELITKRPAEGRRRALEASDLFRYLSDARSLSVRSWITCVTVMAQGLLAAAERSMGLYAEAGARLEKALESASECAACRADIYRRQAIVVAAQGAPAAAERLARKSIALYKSTRSDHDLRNNGLASALLALEQALFADSRFEEAILVVGGALRITDPGVSPMIYRHAIHNMAVEYLEIGTDSALQHAEACLDEAAGFFRGYRNGPCAERAVLRLTYGAVKLRRHDLSGLAMMEKSKNDFVTLEMPREACIVASDLAKYHADNGSAWEAEHTILDLTETNRGARVWLGVLAGVSSEVLDELEAMLACARHRDLGGIAASTARVRSLLKGDNVMPCLV